MGVAIHPFYTLRQDILKSVRQFRHNDDNSDSLFHPKRGFVKAYDIEAVEDALDAYEATLGSDYQEQRPELTPEESLLMQAKELMSTHPSVDARRLGEAVVTYLKDQKKNAAVSVLRSLHYDPDLECV